MHHLTSLALAATALALVGCAPEQAPGTNTGYTTEASSVGQRLVQCWTEPDQFDSTVLVRCGLDLDGPLVATRADISVQAGNTGTGTTLTPEEPVVTVYASNSIPRVKFEATITVDATAVVGVDNFTHKGTLEIANRDEHPADDPAILRAPFRTWRADIVAQDAALLNARIEPYTLTLSDGAMTVEPQLPDVPMGETATVHLAVASETALTGTARISDSAAIDADVPITFQGDGTYIVRADGLEHRASLSGDTPAAYACWIEGEMPTLTCAPGDSGMEATFVELDVALADGSLRKVQVFYESSSVMIIDVDNGDTNFIDGAQVAAPILALEPAQFPLTISAKVPLTNNDGVTTAREGEIMGFGRDPFNNAPVSGTLTIESPATAPASAPLSITLPFALWEVTFVGGQSTSWIEPVLTGYDVQIANAWNGHEAGATVRIEGGLPSVGGNVDEQRFYFAVDSIDHPPITGMVSEGGPTFEITGPGRYNVTPDGITPVAE